MGFARSFTRQLARPRGLLGTLVGKGMTRHNAALNDWVVELLAVRPGDTVLEIGCGAGAALERLAPLASFVVGIDYSPPMVAQARARNRQAIAAGRVEVREGDVLTLLTPNRVERGFDKAMAVQVLYYWADPASTLRHIATLLAPSGTLALGFQAHDRIPGLIRHCLLRTATRRSPPSR